MASINSRRRAESTLRPAGAGPRLSIPGIVDPVFSPERPSRTADPIGADRLCQRLRALQGALNDLTGQARRLARWQARRSQVHAGRVSPFRPGRPPGHRTRPVHEIDLVLADCHALALHAEASAQKAPFKRAPPPGGS